MPKLCFKTPYSSLSPRMTMSEILQEGLQLHEPQLDESQRLTRIVAILQEVGHDSRHAIALSA